MANAVGAPRVTCGLLLDKTASEPPPQEQLAWSQRRLVRQDAALRLVVSRGLRMFVMRRKSLTGNVAPFRTRQRLLATGPAMHITLIASTTVKWRQMWSAPIS